MNKKLPDEVTAFQKRVDLVITLSNRLPSQLKWIASPLKAKLPRLKQASDAAAIKSGDPHVFSIHRITDIRSHELINGY